MTDMEKKTHLDALDGHSSDRDSRTTTLDESGNNSADEKPANVDVIPIQPEKKTSPPSELQRTASTESQIVYPSGVKLTLIITALAFAIFLVALVCDNSER